MSAKDIAEKLLEDYNDVFADIVNTLLFDGKNIINAEDLTNTKDGALNYRVGVGGL